MTRRITVSKRSKSKPGFIGRCPGLVSAALAIVASLFLGGALQVVARSMQKPQVAQEERPSRQAPQVAGGQLEAEKRAMAQAIALVTEFNVNGLKVLVKRREGSQTVAAGLFLRGGSRNITAANAGIETLMLDVMTQGSAGYPRERLRAESARTGTLIGPSRHYDYA